MVTLALSRRLVAQEGGVSATGLKTTRLAAGETVQVAHAIRQLRGLPIWLTDEAVSLREITDLVTTGVPARCGLLIVDYLQLVRAPADVRERSKATAWVDQAAFSASARQLSGITRQPSGPRLGYTGASCWAPPFEPSPGSESGREP